MPKSVLSRDKIIENAFSLIDEKGLHEFSLRKLAAHLNVQVSSLYNHINNEQDLLIEVAKLAADMYTRYVAEAVKDLPLEESTVKAGDAFVKFLREHRSLYELLLDERWVGDPEFDDALEVFVQPIYFILNQYGVTDKENMDHLLVAMRTVTHGFATLEAKGVFDKLDVNPMDSYHMLIKLVIDAMKNM